jgi:hypothetical protein
MSRWPSLADQYALAPLLYGEAGGRLVDEWLAAQTDRVGDPLFAAEFREVRLPGVTEADFAHRIIRSRRGSLLGGIRFRGRDITRPFVEVVGHDFDDVEALRDCAHTEWSAFRPRALRLFARPGGITGPGVVTDLTVHAARCRDVVAGDGYVDLAAFRRDDDAALLVERVYRALAETDPALRRNVSPAACEDLRRWWAEGNVHAVRAGGDIVGLLAVAAGRINWLHGHEIQEEVVAPDHRGHHYAARGQGRWAHTFGDPDRLLVGTIDRLNTASRRTALRAGRPAVLEAVFVVLGNR